MMVLLEMILDSLPCFALSLQSLIAVVLLVYHHLPGMVFTFIPTVIYE